MGKKYRELADIVESIVCFITLPLNNIDNKMLEWSDQEVGKFLVFSDLNVVNEFILDSYQILLNGGRMFWQYCNKYIVFYCLFDARSTPFNIGARSHFICL